MTPVKKSTNPELFWEVKKRLPMAIILFLVFFSGLWLLANFGQRSNFNWRDWTLGTDQMSAKYCEFTNWEATLRQKSNAWSSLAFALAASWVLATYLYCRKWIKKDSAKFQVLFWILILALSGYALAIGSFFFHASLTMAGQKADMGGAYAILISLIFIFLQQRLRSCHKTKSIWLLFAIWVGCVSLTIKLTEYAAGPYLIPFLVGAILLFRKSSASLRPDGSTSELEYLSSAALIAAFIFFELDVLKIGCCPNCVFQFHGLWHFASAIAYGCYSEFVITQSLSPDRDLQIIT